MSVIFRNGYIDVSTMVGAQKYTHKFVQIDDQRSTSQVYIDRIPLIAKIVYDTIPAVPVPYARGDMVTITSMSGFDLISEDNMYWVERAIAVGGPLGGWEVGLVGGRVTNATLSSERLNAATNEWLPIHNKIRVTYTPPVNDVIEPYGTKLNSVILADPFYDFLEGDNIQVISIDGLTKVDTQSKYAIKDVSRFPTPVPHIHLEVVGALQ